MKKQIQHEVLIKFIETENPRQLDNMLYNFEKHLDELKYEYFLKETENPFIYFIEYPKPNELIKITNTENLKIEDIKEVTCTINNLNHISYTIIEKIRYKITPTDTFKINIHKDSYIPYENIINTHTEITNAICNILYISESSNDPTWDINIHLIGELCAISIKRSNKNRNKFSQYTFT
ncbi:hypothetical protein [Methanosphaera cuniculi]|uniref:Uncharacterized protein n=1 Tax=Methanosphaera cuniculi TaxID=1077256 RepID=A0A2A2HDT5_9EURY|nr:hypothetical protein [Methanosphaera cuniculi]PAV07383.1 hypothetical protein ASJ82_00640 [Methanosphaera cuniculi]PWL07964.1 hypothetical protein MSCUN_12070 [Methanosphaera cuniculi]